MGDRVYASITLGGHIETIEEISALCDAIAVSYVADSDFDSAVNDADAARSALRRCVETRSSPNFYGSEVNYGEFDDLEEAAREISGLCCSTSYEAGGGFPAGYSTIMPDGEHLQGNSDGDGVAVSLSDLTKAVEGSDPIGAVKKLIADASAAGGLTMPKFTVSPHVAAWLAIFGEKEPTQEA